MSRTIRVIIADSYLVARTGLRVTLPWCTNAVVKIVGETGDSKELLDLVAAGRPDLVTLDLNLGGCKGLTILNEIRNAHSKTAIILHTALPEEDLGVAALKLGAAAFVPKKINLAEFIKAVELVLSGGKYFSANLGQLMAKSLNQPLTNPFEKLSPAQREVMRRLAAGQINKEIAQDLRVSPKTVSTQWGHIRQKLQINTVPELVRIVDRARSFNQ